MNISISTFDFDSMTPIACAAVFNKNDLFVTYSENKIPAMMDDTKVPGTSSKRQRFV